MSDLRDLYQDVILDHSRQPRNFRELTTPSHEADGYNPLCGDKVKISLQVNENGVVEDIAFQGTGCAISTASASMLTEFLKGKTRAEIDMIFKSFHDMLTGDPGNPPDMDKLGKLAVFSGVCEFPNRVKCATLAWHTLQSALEGACDQTVTTE